MINKKFAEWIDNIPDDTLDELDFYDGCKEAFTAGVRLGLAAIMDSKLRDQLLKELANEDESLEVHTVEQTSDTGKVVGASPT